MKKVIITAYLLIIILLTSSCFMPALFSIYSFLEPTSESFTVSEEIIETRPHFRLGENKNLVGIIEVVAFFMDDDESRWSNEEIAAFKDAHIVPAFDFIEEQAADWDIDVDFEISIKTAVYNGTVNPNLNDGGSTKDTLDQASTYCGYISKEEMLREYRQGNNSEVIFLTIFNKGGISYARDQIKPGTKETGYADYVEHSVIFAGYYENDGVYFLPSDNAATIAHEVLHLFGAMDLYSPRQRLNVSNILYRDDIMLLDSHDLSKLRVQEFTAFSIGWTDSVPKACYIEEFWQE